MRTSRKLTHVLLALMTLVLLSVAVLAADPGAPYPATSEVSDQKAGSLLVYNIYTSNASGGNTQNTRINITNTNLTAFAFVHLFFVSSDCGIADSYICLTPAQTASFLASDVDPGVKGYIVAIAVDASGCPTLFNFLIGDEYVKFSSGHAANLGAEAFSVTSNTICDPASPTAVLEFSGATQVGPNPPNTSNPAGVGSAAAYNKLPRVLAVSNIPSRADGNDTMIIINRIGGNIATGASMTGTLFSIFYDDAENTFSASLGGACQIMGSLSDTFPRLTPRFSVIIPAGRSGWAKFYSQLTDLGLLGASINFNASANAQANAFNGGHNMHKLTLTATNTFNTWLTIPVFPPSC